MNTDDLTAQDIMTRNVACLKMTTTFRDAVDLLLEKGISGAPVVDHMGVLKGVITEEDLIGFMYEVSEYPYERHIGTLKALDAPLITMNCISIKCDTLVTDIIRTMIVRKIKRLPVTDNDGKVIGIVSRTDIFRELIRINKS